MPIHGKVYLIGAGPGDPGLITVKGLRILQKADVVIFDSLANNALLEECNENAELISVTSLGKVPRRQENINNLLISKAESRRVVVRLKGGDPFVFGRGGEEAEALALKNIDFEIIPGISSSIAVPAYAGIPITHRKHASQFIVITGNEDPEKNASQIDWKLAANGKATIVLLMGRKNLRSITNTLIKEGMDPNTPAAIISDGTLPTQKSIIGNLETISDKADSFKIKSPAIAIFGKVVNLESTISWFSPSNIKGKKILITRAEHQSKKLIDGLEKLNASPIAIPTIQIQSLSNYSKLIEALNKINQYSWIVFTSVNSVEIVFSQIKSLGMNPEHLLSDIKIAVIGSATAQAIIDAKLTPSIQPQPYIAEELAESISEQSKSNAKILIPISANARNTLNDSLTSKGFNVETIAIYKTITPKKSTSEINMNLKKGIDIITFTSGSTVKGLFEILDGDITFINSSVVACIGPITAKTCVEYGITPDIIASKHNIEGLIQAINDYFSEL